MPAGRRRSRPVAVLTHASILAAMTDRPDDDAHHRKPPSRILLVRHAHPAAPDGVFLGRSPVALDARGEQQTLSLASRFSAFPAVHSIVSSPTPRARQTAGILASALGLPVQCDDDLCELDFGRWEGLTFAQAHMRDPHAVADWLADEDAFTFPDGECVAGFRQRVMRVGQRLVHADAPLVVTHGGVISALLCLWLRLPNAARMAFRPDHAALSVVHWGDGAGVLEGFNLR